MTTLIGYNETHAQPNLPSEMLDTIVRELVGPRNFDFCAYVDWLADNGWAWPWTDVGMPMLKEIAEEEENLDLKDGEQRVRKQQILKKVRTFVRIRSRLPINCMETGPNELMRLAKVLESSYEGCASLSKSPTWKKACMAGLLGRNTLIKLLPHLSNDFCFHNKELLLQTAFFIGDIDSVDEMIWVFSLSKDDVLNMVSELDIVFSNDVTFFKELLKRVPDLMTTKSLGLIREACSLNRIDMLTYILEVANPVELDELDQIFNSFWSLKLFENERAREHYTEDKQLFYFLTMAAQCGYLPIIQYLWPMMAKILVDAEKIIGQMMTKAGKNNRCSVLEFLLWQSGTPFKQTARKYVNSVLKAAVKRGNFKTIELLARKDDDGQFVAPELCLTGLTLEDFKYVIETNQSWDGIRYLVDLKKNGDSRFAGFKLVDPKNTALCMACKVGNYNAVDNLLRGTDDRKFIDPLMNPAAQNNKPLVNACLSGNLQIVEKLLTRDVSGKYIYQGIDPSAQDYQCVVNACLYNRFNIVKFLFSTNNVGEYVLPGMNDVDFTSALVAAIKSKQMDSLKWLLRMNEFGEYVLLGMNSVDFTRVLSIAIGSEQMDSLKWLLSVNKDGNYVLPGINGVKFTSVLSFAIKMKKMASLKWLLGLNNFGEYVLPGMNGVDFTSVVLAAIMWCQRDIMKWLLSVNNFGEYVLPGMNGVNFTSVLLAVIRSKKLDSLQWLLRMNEVEGVYVLPGIDGVDFTSVLLATFKWNLMDGLKWLLSMKDGKYVLPGMNDVNFTSIVLAAIKWKQREIVQFLLEISDGNYVLPGMNGVDLTLALSTAIENSYERADMDIVEFLLKKSPDGSYLLPGIKVTEDMLGINDGLSEMRDLLELHLGPQPPNA